MNTQVFVSVESKEGSDNQCNVAVASAVLVSVGSKEGSDNQPLSGRSRPEGPCLFRVREGAFRELHKNSAAFVPVSRAVTSPKLRQCLVLQPLGSRRDSAALRIQIDSDR